MDQPTPLMAYMVAQARAERSGAYSDQDIVSECMAHLYVLAS